MTKAAQLEAFVDRLGLRYFKGRDFTEYWSRTRNGVKNHIPDESLWPNVVPTLIVADELRHVLGSALTITSSYRSPAYNRAVGGETNSYHMRFMALDLIPSKATPATVAWAAKKLRGRKFKINGSNDTFVFRGGIGKYPGFVHVDTRGADVNW